MRKAVPRVFPKLLIIKMLMAEPTGFEPATSNVTGWRSNQTELRLRIGNSKCLIRNLKFSKLGGHEGTRTPNFLLVREAVYQLTYMPSKIYLIGKKTSLILKNARIAMLRKFDLKCQAKQGKFIFSTPVFVFDYFRFHKLKLCRQIRQSNLFCR